jgi:hypothetical protein
VSYSSSSLNGILYLLVKNIDRLAEDIKVRLISLNVLSACD